MKNGKNPNPNTIHPIPGYDKEIYVKPTVRNPNIVVGDFTYIADSDFESHVTHLYEWNGDQLVIGKFCQIASGVEFVMNGANHQMNAVSTFPFYTLEGWGMDAPSMEDMPLKGDTIIGNDVWIGQNAVILPGVRIGDGAIIGANSVVGSHVAPYTIVVGNPARELRKRFDDELIELMLRFKWWDKSLEEIDQLIPVLTSSDLETVKTEIKKLVEGIPVIKIEQYVMAYGVEQDRLRAILPEGFVSLRPVLRFNAEIRDNRYGYIEFNTAVEKDGNRGWVNIGYWDNVPFRREGKKVVFKTEFLELYFEGTGTVGSCPAEKDNDGCYFLGESERFRLSEPITANKEFCDCTFRWLTENGTYGKSIGVTLPAYLEEVGTVYPRDAFTADNAARIPCNQVLGAYVVKFDRSLKSK